MVAAVNRFSQNLVLTVAGSFAVSAALNGTYLNFVKPSMRWWLVLAGALLLAIAAHGLFVERDHPKVQPGADERASAGRSGPQVEAELPLPRRSARHERQDHDAHTHGGPRTGWLLVLPFVLLGVVTPAPLGAYAAQRDLGSRQATGFSLDDLVSMPAGDPVTMSLSEFTGRAFLDSDKPMTGRRIRLVGFVSLKDPATPSAGWYLTRMAVSCCAADAYPVRVEVRGAEQLPPDTWIAVVGTWVDVPAPEDGPMFAVLDVESQERVPRPEQPYDQ